MFTLEELNDENFEELSKLKISKKQQQYVLDFQHCLDYRKIYPFLKIYGIKKDKTFIGVTAFARWDSNKKIPVEDRWTWFDEFFIDLKYQHHGYGKKVVPLILDKIKEIYHPKFIVLSVRNDNIPAKKLYEELGFIKTDLVYLSETDSVKHKAKFDATDEYVMYKLV